MNILYIEHYAGTPTLGMEYRPYYLAREWVRSGHQVRIVAADHSHLRIRNPIVEGSAAREPIDGIEYVWLRTPAYEGNGLGRVRNMAAFIRGLYRWSRRGLGNFRPDAVIASSTYPLDNYPARAIARRFGARFVYEVHDLWPLSPIELGGYSRLHPFILAMQAAEDYAYRHCDRVVSLLPCAEDYMRSRGLASGKFAYVPNGIDAGEWESGVSELPEPHGAALREAARDGTLLVCYAGAHGLANALDSFLDAAKMYSGPPARFILVGGGPEKARLEARIRDEGISRALSLPAVPKAAVPALLARMDILYIGLQRQSLFRFGISPNKLIDYMMAGKPVVQAVEAGNDMTAQAGCGISVRPEDPGAIVQSVRDLAERSSAERQALGARGRAYVLANHEYKVLAERFLEAIR